MSTQTLVIGSSSATSIDLGVELTLEALGLSVSRVKNDTEALDIFRMRNAAACVWCAPEIDPPTEALLDRLLASPRIPPLFVVAQSASDELRRALLAAGVVHLFTAPIATEELLARIAGAMRNGARRESRAPTEMITALAHALRSPLRAATANLLCTRDAISESAPKAAAALEDAHQALANIGIVMDDLTIVARAETDTLSINREAFALESVLSKIIESRRSTAQSRGVALSLARWTNGVVDADRNLLSRALQYAIDFALRHAPSSSALEIAIAGSTAVEVHIPTTIPWSGIGTVFCRCVIDAHGGAVSVQEGVIRTVVIRIPRASLVSPRPDPHTS